MKFNSFFIEMPTDTKYQYILEIQLIENQESNLWSDSKWCISKKMGSIVNPHLLPIEDLRFAYNFDFVLPQAYGILRVSYI